MTKNTESGETRKLIFTIALPIRDSLISSAVWFLLPLPLHFFSFPGFFFYISHPAFGCLFQWTRVSMCSFSVCFLDMGAIVAVTGIYLDV